MKNQKILRMTQSAVFCALIFILTSFIKINTINSNYIHLGDCVIYIAACLISTPYAAFSAGVGAMLADIYVGVPVWAPYTLVIKILMVLFFTNKSKILCLRNIIALIIAGIINVGGYALAEYIISGQCLGVISTLIQTVSNTIAFIIIALAVDLTNFRKIK